MNMRHITRLLGMPFLTQWEFYGMCPIMPPVSDKIHEMKCKNCSVFFQRDFIDLHVFQVILRTFLLILMWMKNNIS